jgi:hypothetical protein
VPHPFQLCDGSCSNEFAFPHIATLAHDTVAATHFMCAATPNTREVLIQLPGRDPYHFAFDDVLQEETGQAEVFESEQALDLQNWEG